MMSSSKQQKRAFHIVTVIGISEATQQDDQRMYHFKMEMAMFKDILEMYNKEDIGILVASIYAICNSNVQSLTGTFT